jgi:hypothetical protein
MTPRSAKNTWTIGLTALVIGLLITGCGSDGSTGSTTDTTPGTDTADVVEPETVTPDVTPADLDEPETVAPSDITEDVPKEDVPAPDTTPPEPDAVGPPEPNPVPEGVMFRINWVDVIEPPFCIALDPTQPDVCTGTNELINAYLTAGIGGHLPDQVPMDIVGLFTPFDFDPTLIVDMEFGRGSCDRDEEGKVLACGFWDTPTFFEDTTMQGPGLCTAFDGDEACYTTTAADLTLDFAGVPLDFTDGFTAGQFAFDDTGNVAKIGYGYVQGFMPKTTADLTVIYIGDVSNVISAFLDPADMIEQNGEMGWFFVVDYTALTVPKK